MQFELLKLFSRNVPENDLFEIKKMVAKYFAEKAMNEADKVWDEKGYTNEFMDELANSHLRTSYISQ